MSWTHTALGQVCTIIMGQSPPGSTYNETGQGLPFFQGSKDFGTRYPNERVYCTAPTRIAEEGDILFSVRAPIGSVNRANQKCAIGRGLSVIRANTKSDADFIEFLLRSMHRSWSVYASQGAIFGNARKRDLEELEIVWPPNHVRARIASILSNYDDLIEYNRRRIQLLEQSAQLLYKEWFVHLRFPGHEHVTITDGVPEGWERASVSSFCTVGRGGSPRPIKDYLGGTVPWFKIGDATASKSPFVFSTNEQIIEDGIKKSVFLPPQELILSNSATCGIPYFTGISGCIHDGWLYFKKLQRISKWFLYFGLFAKQNEILMGIGEGTTQKNLNTDYIGKQAFLLPKEDALLRIFDNIVASIFDQIFSLSQQNLQLVQARDLLLPRLMNGEISV